ncbi:YjbE family integral membrane protein [Paenibacillus cellulosilyticus]|uniref:YjbE family integral membrane protein n=1 Tax=Paenibacillus cellulosilyticus TaxID=375489 RepID=A0A2V2YM52_9BACL|nr:TerC family protein [Paenibacillus cellulosilyticus]PWV95438.1 YjbE family integral membrane protein [Paenibacillus cellulosilyticus]QKS43185.1 TerC family protein [Paenibacillus cellulosilyticus]
MLDSLLVFMQIVLINMLLSGDNAVVIAMASNGLPNAQRKKAVWWGSAAAVLLRCILTVAAVALLQIPYLQATGALLLGMIAVKLFRDAFNGDEADMLGNGGRKRSVSLITAIRTIVAADFIMSLDNVLAIAAIADGEPVLLILGIVASIPIIIWGSHFVGALLRKFPPLVYVGAALLGYAAGEMLVSDPGLNKLFHSTSTLHEAVPLFCIPLVIIIGLIGRPKLRTH